MCSNCRGDYEDPEIFEPDSDDDQPVEEMEELEGVELFPEPDSEMDRRVSGPTFAEGWNRLAAMINAYTELALRRPQ